MCQISSVSVLVITITGLMGVEAFTIIPREGWNAREPKAVEPMSNPVPYVVIHHSYEPAACHTEAECIAAMQWMQDFHMDTRGWNDIGYSFAVGGDGNAYEGRGWSRVGAHAPGYNTRSIGICVIGDWRTELPPQQQLEAVHRLIEQGVSKGMISPDYKLIGHRQTKETECPGDRLFAEIQTWDHFTPKPDISTKETEDKGVVSNGAEVNRLFFFKRA